MRLRWLHPWVCAGILAALAPSGAHAQDDVPRDDFSILRYTPAVGPGNYFMVEGAQTPGHVQGSVGLVLDYAHRPFVLWNADCAPDGTDCEVTDERARLVRGVGVAHVTGSLALFDRLQIGLVLPLALMRGDSFEYTTPSRDNVSLPGGWGFALADPRLTVKGRIFSDADSGISLGATAFVTAPTGHYMTRDRYLGDRLPSFGGHAIFQMVNGGFHLAANAGGQWRDETDFFSTHVGPQITWGVALGYQITPLFSAFGEATGASAFSEQVDEHWIEWRAGGRLRVDDFQFHVAAGSGLPPMGVGTPLFRVVGGLSWAPIRADADGDGIEDAPDACPSEAEDMDGWEDEDGCPEEDNDGDGRPDGDDPCPDEAEDRDGFEDEDGCPDTDNDGDGIQDGYDSCPMDAEDFDEDRDEDGCPDNDTDRDGIEDAEDECPNEEEDFDGFGDEDGCPEEDFDEDGLPDVEDQCPDEAEDLDGFEDEDGCPEEGEPAPTRRRRGRRR
ncbi:MAG TPA: thrombospondin type 3 repeat-containing protein [Sandaracinaceae bacterium LLY-WYZ-13_1]|nr:thrombospondin type 3 repeat-containing protein [Sandaracinaceae bacterium LLY-WYZ-13_1]